jgi:putative peptide zinc metalloprotease protein
MEPARASGGAAGPSSENGPAVAPAASQDNRTTSDGADRPRLAEGVELIGEYEGSGYKDDPYVARRADGQVVQLSHLLHLVAEQADGRRDSKEIADRVTEAFGRRVSADNVTFLVDKKLRPLGLIAGKDGHLQRSRKPTPSSPSSSRPCWCPSAQCEF